MLSLQDLGEDIIVSNICSHLEPLDIYHLSLTCKEINLQLTTNDAYHRLFTSMFGKMTPLNLKDYDWKSLFQMRSSKKLNFYSWGSVEQGRLGYLLSEVPMNNRSTNLFGVNLPSLVSNFDKCSINEIQAGGFSFQLLVDKEIYCTGANFMNQRSARAAPGPFNKDYSPPVSLNESMDVSNLFTPRIGGLIHHFVGRPSTVRAEDNPNLRLPPEEMTFPSEIERGALGYAAESRFITKMELPPVYKDRKVRQISSGRQHFIGLDDNGYIFTWDWGNSNWKLGVRLKFPGLQNRISKIFAGWNLSVCYMDNVGLLFWGSRESVSQTEFENGTNAAIANYYIIPDLTRVTDFVALSDCIIYLQDGDLHRFDVDLNFRDHELLDSLSHANQSYLIQNFNRWLSKFNRLNNCEASFTKLNACFESFAVYSDHGLVLLGNKSNSLEDSHEQPIVISELQNIGVIQVVMGDYHYLALTDSGELLSWGLELQSRGCLGLGNLSERKEESIQKEGNSWRVSKPLSVLKPALKGKWMAAVAAGWHSGGLFIPE